MTWTMTDMLFPFLDEKTISGCTWCIWCVWLKNTIIRLFGFVKGIWCISRCIHMSEWLGQYWYFNAKFCRSRWSGLAFQGKLEYRLPPVIQWRSGKSTIFTGKSSGSEIVIVTWLYCTGFSVQTTRPSSGWDYSEGKLLLSANTRKYFQKPPWFLRCLTLMLQLASARL